MSEHPNLRLLRGGREARIDADFARRIGWQAREIPLPDDYEDRLAEQIFGSPEALFPELEAISPDDEMVLPYAAAKTSLSSHAWLAAVAVVLLVGGLAATAAQLLESTVTHVVPLPAPERSAEPREVEILDPVAPSQEAVAEEKAPIAEPDPGGVSASPVYATTRRARGPATSLRGVEGAFSGSRAEAVVGEVELGPHARAERAMAEVVSPDGELPPPSPSLPRVGLVSGSVLAGAPPPVTAPLRWDHLGAAGSEGATMAVVDLVGAGRRLASRL